MTNKTETRRNIGDPQVETTARTAPENGLFGAVRAIFAEHADRIKRWFHPAVDVQHAVSPHAAATVMQKKQVLTFCKTVIWMIAALITAFLFAKAPLAYDTQPLGIAFLSAVGMSFFPAVLLGTVIGALQSGEAAGLYLCAIFLVTAIRYLVGRLTCTAEPEDKFRSKAARTESIGSAAWLRRVVFPPQVFAQSLSLRVGISVVAGMPLIAGFLIGGDFDVVSVCRAVFLLCAVPAFTYLFSGVCGGAGVTVFPALKEGGIGAFCYALTAVMGDTMLFGFSLKLIAAHLITLYISLKGGFLRGGLCGLCCGLACDVLYAPCFALIGAVSGVLWAVHPAPAVLLSLVSGAVYAIYVGAFPAIRSVVPELVAASAFAYPVIRYLSLPDILFGGQESASLPQPAQADVIEQTSAPPSVPGVPNLGEQLDALSGILNGLSVTFYHLSDRVKKPGLYEIRQLCESAADRYCAHCALHELCWEKEFSSTADAMGKITLCVHRKGRAEVSHAFAPLDTRCPSFAKMVAAINDAAAVLCEEKITRDKTEVAAADYEGMARLLRSSAEENAHACSEDKALSKRLERAMGRIGFRAQHVAVYGNRRRTVVATGIDLGLHSVPMRHAVGENNGMVSGSSVQSSTLLGTEELREAFSALAGVNYQSPDYTLTDGGRNLMLIMRAQPKIAVECGCWGEKKPGEEVTGDVLTLFANRSDYFYALLCDGMGSGREASVTAQISALFLEKLLSVSTAKGAALNLLNNFLRSRQGECSATVDLCEVDMITGEAKFVKCGAAATYLMRGDHMFRIASGTMPLGILKEVSAEETTFALEDGDMLLFFSDGVCGECEDSAWILQTAKDTLRQSGDQKKNWEDTEDDTKQETSISVLDKMAAGLGKAAKMHCERRDDMTVAVLKIKEVVPSVL